MIFLTLNLTDMATEGLPKLQKYPATQIKLANH
jgi:hypothetical protein